MSRVQLLRNAVSLVQNHGFTRRALSESVMTIPGHTEPLPETAVSALFGQGDNARRTLINAWLEDGIEEMKAGVSASPTMRHILRTRLKYNEPVLQHLPEVNDLRFHSSGAYIFPGLCIAFRFKFTPASS